MSKFGMTGFGSSLANLASVDLAQINADRLNVAKRSCQVLAEEICEFEKSLKLTEEIGARFVAGADGQVFHVESLDWVTAELVRFDGKDANGRPVRQIQHVSQLNIQLVALPVKTEKANRIGFPLTEKFKA